MVFLTNPPVILRYMRVIADTTLVDTFSTRMSSARNYTLARESTRVSATFQPGQGHYETIPRIAISSCFLFHCRFIFLFLSVSRSRQKPYKIGSRVAGCRPRNTVVSQRINPETRVEWHLPAQLSSCFLASIA